MSREIICITCPLGCNMEVTIDGEEIGEIRGNRCKKGVKYAKKEVFHPARVLTTTIQTNNANIPLLPVRSEKEIPKEKLMECMKEIARNRITESVSVGEIVIQDILNLRVNIVASRSMA